MERVDINVIKRKNTIMDKEFKDNVIINLTFYFALKIIKFSDVLNGPKKF